MKKFDLEQRTLKFSKEVMKLLSSLEKNIMNKHIAGQCFRSATSIGANYREANDALGKRDFLMRAKIARKEAKETTYWLELIQTTTQNKEMLLNLIQESKELTYVLSAIIKKATNNK